jgi:hypothetical protein
MQSFTLVVYRQESNHPSAQLVNYSIFLPDQQLGNVLLQKLQKFIVNFVTSYSNFGA